MSEPRKKYTEEFKREAVDLVLSSGRSYREVAAELGICVSNLGRWLRAHRDVDLMSGPHDDDEKELARLRREVQLLRRERDLLKKATVFFAMESQ